MRDRNIVENQGVPEYATLSKVPDATTWSGLCFIQDTKKVYRSDGSILTELMSDVSTNYIGIAGSVGFGVGICPNMPGGFSKLSGTTALYSDNYGNYQFSDGSIMCWIPAFYYKYGTGANGLAINVVDIKAYNYYNNVADANALGYALPRAFYNAGAIQPGVFVDKYLCSNNGGIASSIKLGLPLSSNSAHNPFAGLNGTPANFNYGAIAAAKTRGTRFFTPSVFIYHMLAMLSLAHGQAATSTAACAWYDAAGVNNFPKGCNNNALGDNNDTTLTFISDGYPNCAKTGSASNLAKTTHNGQACGIADINGNMFEIALGMTADTTNFYLLKTSVDIAALTAGTTLATDAWGATGIAAQYDSIGATYESLTASSTTKSIGSATQVFSAAVSGTAWAAAGAGIPLVGGTGGTNMFGSDALYDYRLDTMCPVAGGAWNSSSSAGVWLLNLSTLRGNSYLSVGFRSALYL